MESIIKNNDLITGLGSITWHNVVHDTLLFKVPP